MNAKELRASVSGDAPPEGLSGPLAGLWHLAKGDWHKAHEIVQDDESREAAWVHAHLHRIEGDDSNAGYWYRKAGQQPATGSIDDEWLGIASALATEN